MDKLHEEFAAFRLSKAGTALANLTKAIRQTV
jgi:hypothetical protein